MEKNVSANIWCVAIARYLIHTCYKIRSCIEYSRYFIVEFIPVCVGVCVSMNWRSIYLSYGLCIYTRIKDGSACDTIHAENEIKHSK